MKDIVIIGQHNSRPKFLGRGRKFLNKERRSCFMNRKWFMLVAGMLLSAMFLTGCATNNDQEPPPPNNDVDLNDNNGVDRNNNGNDLNNNGNDLNNNNGTNDQNLNNDGDMMKDNNTPREDLIEDKLDRNDADNRDR